MLTAIKITPLAKQMLENGPNNLLVYSRKRERGYMDSLSFKVNAEPANGSTALPAGRSVKVYFKSAIKNRRKGAYLNTFPCKVARTFSRWGISAVISNHSAMVTQASGYDRYGWHPIPYLDQGEFYSEYGSF